MSTIVGEVGLGIKAAISLGQCIAEAAAFPSELRELASRCKVIQTTLETKEFSENELPGLRELRSRLEKCELYIKSCQERKFVRNPFFEVTFHRRIGKHLARLDGWISLVTLSLSFSVNHA